MTQMALMEPDSDYLVPEVELCVCVCVSVRMPEVWAALCVSLSV